MPGPVLVIGDTGRTGRLVVERLLARGYPARVLTRDPGRAQSRFGAGVAVFGGDVTDAGGVRAAMESADGVVVIVESSNSDYAPNSPERAHYGGARNVIAAATGRGAHVVLVSQIYITRPERYPEVRNVIYWRGVAEETVRESGLPYTIVRPGWLTDQPNESLRFEQCDAGSPARASQRSASGRWRTKRRGARRSRSITSRAHRRRIGRRSLPASPPTGPRNRGRSRSCNREKYRAWTARRSSRVGTAASASRPAANSRGRASGSC